MINDEEKYIHYNRITSYEEFVDYCLRALGAPVVDINLAPEQIFDRISEGLQYYLEYDLESVAECWWLHKVTAEDAANGYLKIPFEVLDVMEVMDWNGTAIAAYGTESDATNNSVSSFLYGDPGFAGDAYMSSYNYQWWNSYWMYGASNFSGSNTMFYYEVSMQYINLLRNMFSAKVEYLYRRRQRKLWLYSHNLVEGSLVALYGTKILDPETDDCIWDSDWLKKYCIALLGVQWGTNLTKFSSIPSAGNLTIDGAAILSRYQEEKSALEEKHRLEFEEPPMPFIG